MSVITFDTKFGEVDFRDVIIDLDGTNVENGVDVNIDGKNIGQLLGYTTIDLSEHRVNEIEEIISIYC